LIFDGVLMLNSTWYWSVIAPPWACKVLSPRQWQVAALLTPLKTNYFQIQHERFPAGF